MTATEIPAGTPQSDESLKVMGKRRVRREDPALLSGESRFVADLVVPGVLHAAIVRSSMAHGTITSIDFSDALAMPGVVAAFSGEDLAGEWAAPMPCAWPVTEDMKNPPHLPVAVGTVNYVGDAVAVVLAQSEYQAHDAADAVIVDIEALPAVVDLDDALSDRVLVHEDLGTNTCYTWEIQPDPEALEAAFADAAHTVSERYVQQRLLPSPMETRGVVVVPQPFGGDYTVYSSTQIPHILKVMLAVTTGINETQLRVVAPSVGGGFGAKLNVYAEEVLGVVLAKRMRRPIRWIEERSEHSVATVHGRGQIQNVELAATAEGKITAVRVRLLADMGGYLQLITPGIPLLGAFIYGGVYDIANFGFTCTGVFTTKTPTDAYRGAGRPEACYAIERSIDALAAAMDLDPAELRRRNFIQPDQFPYPATAGLVYDSGDYEPAMDKALEHANYIELRAEQTRRRDAGDTKLLGIGISSYFEMCGLAPSRALGGLGFGVGGWEAATVRIQPTGKVQVVTGTTPHGQGHETSWSMIVAEKLGISPDEVDVLHSDTAVSPFGLDTYGSRSLAVGGTAVFNATDRVVDKAAKLAAHLMEVAEEDLTLRAGSFEVKGSPDRKMAIAEVAFAAFTAHNLPEGMEPNLEGISHWDPPNFTFPFGTHICIVEVDTETGSVNVDKYVAVDDCGNQVNPLIVEGQLHGGIVQGAAQALLEEAIYDDDGNLLTATLMDYMVPSATEFPSFVLDHTVTPSPVNPMGVKGVGEAGTIGAAPAVMNAIIDALRPLGITNMEMPASPNRVWSAINAAAATSSAKGGAA
ncbi:MAG: xanthine dehydrogenase family protein molybdopterin-binding subunit [Actinomycetota bacterium]|nr:xanthine dehydrogenase family protein molybdopterin-binding subunit [Actinomycetota bacterium]